MTSLFWGTTSSSLQSEGVAPSVDWWRWEKSNRVPRSGDGNGFATNHRDDFTQLSSLGLTHVRLTLEWARLEPEPGKLDATAFDLYQDILSSAADAGLSVIATLADTTLPGWFSDDTPGFTDAAERERWWARHVDRCAERYDDLVDTWVPIDDPLGWAVRGFHLGSRPPGRQDPEAAASAMEGALRASHLAWEILRSGDTPVMGVFGVPTIFAHGEDAGAATRWWHEALIGSWLSVIRDGELLIPGASPRQVPEMAGAYDLVGITHDHPIAVDRTGAVKPYPPQGRRTDTGFTPVPNELVELLSYLTDELPGRQLVVAGHGVATTDDEWREEILRETVTLLADAVRSGLPVLGYLHDTGIDGYEGPFGFRTKRGLVERDRMPKESARWLQTYLAGS